MIGGVDSATLPYAVTPNFHGRRFFNSLNSVLSLLYTDYHVSHVRQR